MGFWLLLEVAAMPILEVLIICALGAFMATPYCSLLASDSRKSLNKLVFIIFTPALIFSSLAKTVTLRDIISWWFMPVNIGIIFLVGAILGHIFVRLLKPPKQLEGLIVAFTSAGNLGNLMLIMIGAICEEKGAPFGDSDECNSVGLSYASFSMALGGFYIWTHTYQLMRTSSLACNVELEHQVDSKEENEMAKEILSNGQLVAGCNDLNSNISIEEGIESPLLSKGQGVLHEDTSELAVAIQQSSSKVASNKMQETALQSQVGTSKWGKIKAFLHQIVEELMAPPTVAAFLGFIFGASEWLRFLIIGESAPLRVIQSAITVIGDGTIPCITLILGANLTGGLRAGGVHWRVIAGVVFVRYVILPTIGIGVVQAAGHFGFLPADPLYQYVLMIQFTLPPAMNIGTMAELFDVGKEECSVIFLWSYLAAVPALTLWPIAYMSIISS